MTKPEIATKMAELVQQKEEVEEKKSSAAKKYNDDIKNIESQITYLSKIYLQGEQSDLFDDIAEDEDDLSLPDLKEKYGIDIRELNENCGFLIANELADLEQIGITNIEENEFDKVKGKLVISFPDEDESKTFVQTQEKIGLYERYGNYIFFSPINLEATACY